MSQLGKALVALGLLLLVAGLVVLFLNKIFPSLGKLPGDIRWEGERTTIYLPLTTMFLLSLLGSLLLSALLWLFRR